jgi:hypothetical protein
LGGLSDDQLGGVAVALVVSELSWTPDVAPAVMDRISRDAVAYPDHFDRRTGPSSVSPDVTEEEPTVGRTIRRVLILGVVVLAVVVLVMAAVAANASGGPVSDPAGLGIVERAVRILEAA